MLVDQDNQFTTDQSATVHGQLITATDFGGRALDGGAARDWGAGEIVVPYFRVTGVAASNPTTSITVDIIGSTTIAGTGSAVVLSTRTVLVASLAANTIWYMPPLVPGYRRRYLVAKFTADGGSATTGAYVCGLVDKNARVQDGVLANTL